MTITATPNAFKPSSAKAPWFEIDRELATDLQRRNQHRLVNGIAYTCVLVAAGGAYALVNEVIGCLIFAAGSIYAISGIENDGWRDNDINKLEIKKANIQDQAAIDASSRIINNLLVIGRPRVERDIIANAEQEIERDLTSGHMLAFAENDFTFGDHRKNRTAAVEATALAVKLVRQAAKTGSITGCFRDGDAPIVATLGEDTRAAIADTRHEILTMPDRTREMFNRLLLNETGPETLAPGVARRA